MVGHISVKYEEADPTTYSGIEYGWNRKYKIINTGNPSVDYIIAMILLSRKEQETGHPIMRSSSVDHFIMDGGEMETEDFSEEHISAARKYLNPKKYG